MNYCHSCSAPLTGEFKGASDRFCKYCVDESGGLKSREDIQAGIAHWLMTWDSGLSDDKARVRAAHYMKAMPAWADD